MRETLAAVGSDGSGPCLNSELSHRVTIGDKNVMFIARPHGSFFLALG